LIEQFIKTSNLNGISIRCSVLIGQFIKTPNLNGIFIRYSVLIGQFINNSEYSYSKSPKSEHFLCILDICF
jgi:hypothetical protein